MDRIGKRTPFNLTGYAAIVTAAIPILIVVFLALYPQLTLIKEKGGDWQGSTFSTFGDEAAYAAYTNALIHGRPRKNDPWLGKDDSADDPQPESFYSIQFVPAYGIALPARIMGISAHTAFLILLILTAACSTLTILGLIRSVTRDDMFAAAGSVIVTCLGTAAALQGEIRHWLGGRVLIEFFTFLRSYQPAFVFPMFFVFCILIWKLFTTEDRKRSRWYLIASGLTLWVLIFSYFYLWTAAAAWLACFVLIWLVLRPSERRSTAYKGLVLGAFGISALLPYSFLLAGRSTKSDEIQVLITTHAPDLNRFTLILGLIIVIAVVLMALRQIRSISSPESILVISLGLTPVVLFNQQILTGRSLQPFHYDLFIANYLVLTAAVLLLWLLVDAWRSTRAGVVFRSTLLIAALAAVGWGFYESRGYMRRNVAGAKARDDATKALKYVEQQGTQDGQNIVVSDRYRSIFSPSWPVIEQTPVVTSHRPLWNLHSSSAGGLNRQEEKELFYRFLYYSDFDEGRLREQIKRNNFLIVVPLFGFAKVLPELGNSGDAISAEDIESEVKNYSEFSAGFDRFAATDLRLDYAIVESASKSSFNNLDRWYQRDDGREIGRYIVYKLSPRLE